MVERGSGIASTAATVAMVWFSCLPKIYTSGSLHITQMCLCLKIELTIASENLQKTSNQYEDASADFFLLHSAAYTQPRAGQKSDPFHLKS